MCLGSLPLAAQLVHDESGEQQARQLGSGRHKDVAQVGRGQHKAAGCAARAASRLRVQLRTPIKQRRQTLLDDIPQDLRALLVVQGVSHLRYAALGCDLPGKKRRPAAMRVSLGNIYLNSVESTPVGAVF